MSMPGCPHCGYSNAASARFCVHCGTDLTRGLPRPPLPGDREVDEETGERVAGAGRDDSESAAEQESTAGHSEQVASQRATEKAAGTEAAAQDAEGDDLPPEAEAQPEPLLSDLQGLLEPVDPLSFLSPDTGGAQSRSSVPGLQTGEPEMDEEERRQIRDLFSGDLPLAAGPAPQAGNSDRQPPSAGRGLPRRKRLEWLLLLALTIAMLWESETPGGRTGPHGWPGLEQAHQQVDTLPPNSVVLVYWAYDPATAGEMDLVAQPVIEHILQRQAKPVVVSQLPGGPATARRLIAKAEEAMRRPGRLPAADRQVIEAGFLPGGVASLSLLAVAPARTLPVDSRRVDVRTRFTVATLTDSIPVLTLLISAGAEDVRRWLEQVQPLNGGTVVAITSAVADPALRPYLHSGQLAGLVSGWDGGRAYQRLSERTRSVEEQARTSRLASGQNWGFGVLLVAVVLGNLAGLAERRRL